MKRTNRIHKKSKFVKMAQTINRLELIEAMAAQPAPKAPLADRIGAMLRGNRHSHAILVTASDGKQGQTEVVEVIE